MHTKTLSATAVALLLGAAGANADLIDNFNSGDGSVAILSGDAAGTSYYARLNCGLDCIGGERDLGITRVSGTGLGNSLEIISGVLAGAAGPGDENDYFVEWDGSADGNPEDTDTTGLGGLTFAPTTGLLFQVLSLDVPNAFDFQVQVWDASGALATTWAAGTTGGFTTSPPGAPFSLDFGIVGSGANLGNGYWTNDPTGTFFTTGLGAIRLSFQNTAEDVDFRVDIFEQVPEPSIVALFGLGLAGLGFASRRGRKA
jgi:hypothetical protein